MSKLDAYNQAKDELRRAEDWASMIGKPYNGGGGGIGKLHGVTVSTTIYYQPYNGANNYHDSERDLNIYLAEAIKDHFGIILTTALQCMRRKVKSRAEAALIEHSELMKDSGLGGES